MAELMTQVASDAVMNATYEWLCERQHHYHHSNDVWQVRRWWAEKKPWVRV
jgi:hypothetical protein